MKILVACEWSGTVRDAFIRAGHQAVSCDMEPTAVPGPHHEGNVLDIINDGWHMLVAFPPCTYLCSSGLHWNKRQAGRQAKTEAALQFVQALMDAPMERIAIENPVGCISTRIRKPDQQIQPYQFGHDASKGTCLWLKNLPTLQATKHVDPTYACRCGHRFESQLGKYGCPNCCAESGAARQVWANQTPSGQNKLGPSADRAKKRGKTYQGISDAMAAQWGSLTDAVHGAAQLNLI